LSELALGIARLPAGRRRPGFTEWLGEVRQQFRGRILPFDEPAALAYGEIVAAARAQGKPPQVGDAQIAAVARCHGLAVATRDVAGFAHLGIEIVDPWHA
jgi:predicted nucleic acid-binding protein